MAAVKLVSNAQDIVKQLTPFFTAKILFRSASGNYHCALCSKMVKDNEDSAISYGASRYGTWSHAACVKQARASVIDDADAKKQAKLAAQKEAQKEHKATASKGKDKSTTKKQDKTVADTTPDTAPDYEALMVQALEAIEALEQKLAAVTAQNDQLRAAMSEHKEAVTA